MGLTMAQHHRQANGQFKEEPGTDAVSSTLDFLYKVDYPVFNIYPATCGPGSAGPQ